MPPIKDITTNAEAQAVMPQVTRFYNALESFKVNSAGSWLEAGEKIKLAKERIKQVKAIRKEFLDPINDLKDKTMAHFEPALTKLEMIVDNLGKKMAEWREEQAEKERIAQEKADAEARKKEEEERERLREEARIKDEAARKAQEEADAAKKKAEELAKKEDFEKAERARIESEKKGEEAAKLKTEAKEFKEEAKGVEVEAKEVKSKAVKIDGLHFRRIWKFRIKDKNKVPREYLIVDDIAVGEAARRDKENTKIPGIEVYYEDVPVG